MVVQGAQILRVAAGQLNYTKRILNARRNHDAANDDKSQNATEKTDVLSRNSFFCRANLNPARLRWYGMRAATAVRIAAFLPFDGPKSGIQFEERSFAGFAW